MKRKLRLSRRLDHYELEQRGRIHFVTMEHTNGLVITRDPNMIPLRKMPSHFSFEFAEKMDPMMETMKKLSGEAMKR